jgi:hypothetical protein
VNTLRKGDGDDDNNKFPSLPPFIFLNICFKDDTSNSDSIQIKIAKLFL